MNALSSLGEPRISNQRKSRDWCSYSGSLMAFIIQINTTVHCTLRVFLTFLGHMIHPLGHMIHPLNRHKRGFTSQ